MYVHNQDWESAQRVAEAHDPGSNPNADKEEYNLFKHFSRSKVIGYKKVLKDKEKISIKTFECSGIHWLYVTTFLPC